MDADILRLILFIAGVGVILGIYFWDRYKRVNQRVHAIRKSQLQAPEQAPLQADPPEPVRERVEPAWETASDPSVAADRPEESAGATLDAALQQLGQMVQQERKERIAPGEQTEFAFPMDEQDAPVGQSAPEIPKKLLQLNVVTRSTPFAGEAIMRAMRDLGLELGEMQIFHRYREDATARPLFSVASMVEPGTFPERDMAAFTTPGLVLFAQLPGPVEGLKLFEQMLDAAQRLTALLGGELQDETHSDLSRQTIDHIREEIAEHGRLVRLARSR